MMSRIFQISIALLLASVTLQAQGQNTTLQSRIDAATQTLIDLDKLAQSCLESTELDSDGNQDCSSFLEAIDGPLLASYLDHCRNLKTWRDDYVGHSHSTGLAIEQDPTALQTLVGIEYACGENALQKRTKYVSEVFTLVASDSRLNQVSSANALRRIAEFEYDTTSDNERRRLLQSIKLEQSRRLQETQNQFNKLETELIRQQINN